MREILPLTATVMFCFSVCTVALWDLSSLTGDRKWGPSSESSPSHWAAGKFRSHAFLNIFFYLLDTHMAGFIVEFASKEVFKAQ